MARGGKREKAGRKTSWESGVKFEETSPVRVPNHIKDKVLEIAHRLDAGEDIDLVSNSKKQELESKLALFESENQKLLEQIENYRLDLETKSQELQLNILNIQELQQKNNQLQSLTNRNELTSASYSSTFIDSISQFVQKWRKQINGLSALDVSTKTHQMLLDLQKIISDEKSNFNIITNLENISDDSKKQLVTESSRSKYETVTKSESHTQLGLLDIENNKYTEILSPLTATELSKRFNKNVAFVKAKKNYYKDRPDEFLSLLKQLDPHGVGWRYSKEDRKYHPILNSES